MKLIGLRELWRVKRGGEKARWIEGTGSRWVHPCYSLLTNSVFIKKRCLSTKEEQDGQSEEAGSKNLAPFFVILL